MSTDVQGETSLFGVFESPSDAARGMGLKYHNITRHINKGDDVVAGTGALRSMLGKKFAF